MNTAAVSPQRIAEALGLPPPTEEQSAVIAAPPGPTLVVAGAGAGKTETMAARVVWMVANRLVTPEQVLGLTFTRKAAQQLTSRIRTRLARLAGSPLLRELDPTGELRTRLAGAEPEISTYHSYAGRLLGEHGLLLPVEPSATLLTETQLWQLAHQVVRTWDGDLETERTPVSVTEAVLALSGQLAEHLVEPEQLAEAHTDLEKLVFSLPPGPRQRGGPSQNLQGYVKAQRERVALLPLVRQLGAALRRRGALDFGAQMSLAARLAAEHPEVPASERGRFRLVLLDEYQDTGHAQRILLSALFGGLHDDPGEQRLAVTAVGDPMQSIYGWRGASAANLPRFATDFPLAPGVPAPTLSLLTSWRNPPEALALANLVSDPLRQRALESGGVTVDALRARPGAEAGAVALALIEDIAAEREWAAERIAAEWAARHAAGASPPTSAVLVRRNADAAPLAEALRERGLPVEIVGLGGLLATPEVADVVATLRLIAEPGAGSAAVRVLTGARWRIGVADLRALARRARDLSIGRPTGDASDAITDGAALDNALREVAPEPAEQAGLADAIADPGPAEHYSEAGYARIVALARELAALRERSGQPLTELVADVERTIGVGVETQARRAMAGTGAGREHLDAFAEVVAGYAADSRASLGGLLAFLAAAESVENGLEPGEVEVAKDRVQVLTVHAAKGLEWEIVAVPHVSVKVFPSGAASATWLGALAELPTSLRGDRATEDAADGVPVLDLSDLHDRAELEAAINDHKAALDRRRLDEERRLFYVALTRTERVLLVSAHHWAETGNKPKGPSDFLLELKAAAETPGTPAHGTVEIARWDDPPEAGTANPFTDNPATAEWPRDPLGSRRDPIEEGAALVRTALAELRAQEAAARTRKVNHVAPESYPAAGERSAVSGVVSQPEGGAFAGRPGRRRHTSADRDSALSDAGSRESGSRAPAEPDALFEFADLAADGDAPPPDGFAPPPEGLVPPLDDFVPPPDGFVPPPDEFAPPPEGFASPTDAPASPASPSPQTLAPSEVSLAHPPHGADSPTHEFASVPPDDAYFAALFADDEAPFPEDFEPPPDEGAFAAGPVDPDDPEGWKADVDALLAEFEASRAAEREVELPGQIPATALVEMRADPERLARRLRRPLPFPPDPMARRGTAFHAWVQRWFAGTRLLGLDELPGAGGATADAGADAELTKMQDAFLNSPWAHRSPLEVEVPFETSIAGTVIRGRMDAVFAEGDGWLVVDWKTGAQPGPDDEPAVAMQLAIYRLAWARLMVARHGGTEREMLEKVGAAFHYIRSGRTIAPGTLPGPDELADLIRSSAPPRDPPPTL
ncbi:ATP-dependent DNA helicase [Nocardia puris]|uniref:DNA 3'-5' helicase n=1 Tax=Nocardia puris TaxID=208602 RepID=A0A366DQM0_9NOCA|nr:ATP-dependent DNA helicase [Nocardia puris]RBO92391.1 superfamily I DNA/RNA helicase [Nocardia puris]